MIRESSVLPLLQIPHNKSLAHHRVDRGGVQTFSRSRWRVGAALGLLSGFLAITVGLLLSALCWLAGNEFATSNVGQMGSWLLIGTFPALMFGAYCLDKIEEASKTVRLERCRQNGMTDEQCQ